MRTSRSVYNYYLWKILSKTFCAMMNIVVALPSSCAKEFRGHFKIVKQVERRRDRELSGLPKKIIRSMKKIKVRCKLKCILRKYIFLNRPDCMYGLGPVQTSNFSCTEPNVAIKYMKSSTYESIRSGRFVFGSTVPFYPTGLAG